MTRVPRHWVRNRKNRTYDKKAPLCRKIDLHKGVLSRKNENGVQREILESEGNHSNTLRSFNRTEGETNCRIFL